MIKLVLCDDETEIVSDLNRIIETHYKDTFFIDTTNSPTLLIDRWIETPCEKADILITDIQFDKNNTRENGIYAARKIQEVFPETQVIFMTSYLEYAADIFEASPVSFLAKPIEPEKLFQAIDKSVSRVKELKKRAVYMETKKSLEKIYIKDICYAKSSGRSITLHLKDKELVFHMKMDQLEEKLKDSMVRTHQSYLVNMEHIEKLERTQISLKDGILIPVSRMKYPSVRQKLLKHIGDWLV